MRGNTGKHDMESLFVLLSFGVFAVCVLLVLLTGANGYRAQVDRDQQSWNRRTSLQYVAAKVRHADGAANSVALSGGDGAPWYHSLNLTEEVDGRRYTTRIYCYDGAVRELYAEDGAVFDPDAGEKVLDAQGLRFALDGDGLLTVEAADSAGEITTAYLTLRSGEGAAA